MPKKTKITMVIFVLFQLIIAQPCLPNWIGPREVVIGEWGHSEKQFYFSPGDSEEYFPREIRVNSKNEILVKDEGNKRVQIFSSDGKLNQVISPPIEFSKLNSWPYEIEVHPNGYFLLGAEGKRLFYDYKGNLLKSNKIIGETYIRPEGYFFRYKESEYILYSFTGELLKTYDKPPLELGIVYEGGLGNGNFESTIEFPDYKYLVHFTVPKYSRDILANLYVGQTYSKEYDSEIGPITRYRVIRVDRCMSEEHIFEPPKSEYEPWTAEEKKAPTWQYKLGIEYGEPIVSPLGDLYCWARTKTHYKILKWTWQGPEDAPQSLQISNSIAGLKLNWQKPVKETESVTGYQVLRSTEVCGPFTEVVTLKKDKFVFEDMTIKPPWKYYYVVKAIRDKKCSGDSNKVYMQWK